MPLPLIIAINGNLVNHIIHQLLKLKITIYDHIRSTILTININQPLKTLLLLVTSIVQNAIPAQDKLGKAFYGDWDADGPQGELTDLPGWGSSQSSRDPYPLVIPRDHSQRWLNNATIMTVS